MDAERFKNLPDSLREKAEQMLKRDYKIIANFCAHKGISAETTEALKHDYTDLIGGVFLPMRATAENMREFLNKTKTNKEGYLRAPNLTGVGLLHKEYRAIITLLDINPIIPPSPFWDAIPIIVAAILKNLSTEEFFTTWCGGNAQMLRHVRGSNSTFTIFDEAQATRYIYSLLILGENTDATAEELKAVTTRPAFLTDIEVERAIEFARQGKEFRERQKAPKKEKQKGKGGEKKVKNTAAETKEYTAAPYSFIRAITDLQIAQKGGDKPAFASLREQVYEWKKKAAEILNSPLYDEEVKKQTAQGLASVAAALQTLDALPSFLKVFATPQDFTPNDDMLIPSGATEGYTKFKLTPREIVKLITGTDNPNNTQINVYLRALIWLSGRYILKTDAYRSKKEGKVKYNTDWFTPIRLRGNAWNDTPLDELSKTQKLEFEIATDNSPYTIKEGKTIYYKQQQVIYTTEPQRLAMQAFGDAAGIRFLRYIQTSREHCIEDKLLNLVFDYDNRQAVLDKEKEEALKAAEIAGTEEARIAAEEAVERAKLSINKNKGRDVATLSRMFKSAIENNIIVEYNRQLIEAKKKEIEEKGLTIEEAIEKRVIKRFGEDWKYIWTPKPSAKEEAAIQKHNKGAIKNFVQSIQAHKKAAKLLTEGNNTQ